MVFAGVATAVEPFQLVYFYVFYTAIVFYAHCIGYVTHDYWDFLYFIRFC